MKKTLQDRIATLAAMNVPALREEHRKVFGKEPASSHRQFLFRKIAWRLQADAEGWQPDGLLELARGIARNSPLRNRVVTNASKRHAGLPPEQTAVATIEPDRDPRLPMPGGWIMKQYKGRSHVVQVLDDGRFAYNDRRYTSLSAIAQEITGTKWNGLLFFGLTEKENGRR
ncbi:MAG: DUF2924 domain-containing protein [Bryobacteraceae bacterium]|jgi:hypothetical protein